MVFKFSKIGFFLNILMTTLVDFRRGRFKFVFNNNICVIIILFVILQIKRAVAYDNFKKHISRWSAVIEKNKSADQLIFPLKNNEVEVFDNRMVDFASGFSQPSDLQRKITDILQSSAIIKEKQSNLVIN